MGSVVKWWEGLGWAGALITVAVVYIVVTGLWLWRALK